MSKIISCGERTVQVKERIALSDIAKKYDIEPGDIVRVTIQKVEDENTENEMVMQVLRGIHELAILSADCSTLMAKIGYIEDNSWNARPDDSLKIYQCGIHCIWKIRHFTRKLQAHFKGECNVSSWYMEPMEEYSKEYTDVAQIRRKICEEISDKAIKNMGNQIYTVMELQLKERDERIKELEEKLKNTGD